MSYAPLPRKPKLGSPAAVSAFHSRSLSAYSVPPRPGLPAAGCPPRYRVGGDYRHAGGRRLRLSALRQFDVPYSDAAIRLSLGIFYAWSECSPDGQPSSPQKITRLLVPSIVASTIYFLVTLIVPDGHGRIELACVADLGFPLRSLLVSAGHHRDLRRDTGVEHFGALATRTRYGAILFAAFALNDSSARLPNILQPQQGRLFVAVLPVGARAIGSGGSSCTRRRSGLVARPRAHDVPARGGCAVTGRRLSAAWDAAGDDNQCHRRADALVWFPHISPLARLGLYSSQFISITRYSLARR